MFVDNEGSELVFLTDRRSKYDQRLGGQAVMRGFSLGKKTLGHNWLRTTRVAAYDPDRQTSANGRAHKRDEIRTILARLRPRVVVVMASRSRNRKQKMHGAEHDDGEDESVKGTLCWEALNPPAGIAQMCGTFWRWEGMHVVALQNPFNEEHVYNWQIANHLQRAWRVATGAEKVFHSATSAGDRPREDFPLAVDIETIPSTDTITMIGVSDGHRVKSYPWDEYQVYNTGPTPSRGANASEAEYLRRILATEQPKILHNAEYDIPFLRSRGIEVNGPIVDTMLLHGVAYKQFRHGLQACVAQELAVPPWKTLFGAGRDRSPDPRVWAMRQRELRVYNEQDTYFTWHLARALAPKVGIRF